MWDWCFFPAEIPARNGISSILKLKRCIHPSWCKGHNQNLWMSKDWKALSSGGWGTHLAQILTSFGPLQLQLQFSLCASTSSRSSGGYVRVHSRSKCSQIVLSNGQQAQVRPLMSCLLRMRVVGMAKLIHVVRRHCINQSEQRVTGFLLLTWVRPRSVRTHVYALGAVS